MEPIENTAPIMLPGQVAPGEPIPMPGKVVEPEAIKDYKGILATTEKGEIYKLTFNDYIWAQKQDAARNARRSPVSEAEKERREERALKSFEDESYIKKFRDIHKEAVKKALEKGYTVPQEVLNEYPELQNQTVIRADERKDPLEMAKDEFVKEYMKIVENVRRAEKDEEIEPIPENIGTVNHSNWEEWSRKRGYTEQEIEDFKYMLKFFGEGLSPDINERLWSAVDEGYLDFIDTEWGTKEYDPEMLYDVLQGIREAKLYKDTEGEFSFPVEGEAEEPQIEAPGAPRNKIKTGDRVRWTTEPIGGKTETFEGTIEQIQPTDAGNRVIIRTDDGRTIKGFDYKGKLEVLSEEQADSPFKTIKTKPVEKLTLEDLKNLENTLYTRLQSAKERNLPIQKQIDIEDDIIAVRELRDRKAQEKIKAEEKGPWEMPLNDYIEYFKDTYLKDAERKYRDEEIEHYHKEAILQAAYEGKSIPEEALKEHRGLKDTVTYIQAEIKADDAVEAAEYRMAELENKAKQTSRDELEYRLLQIRTGEAKPDEVMKGLSIAKSGVRNELGNYEDRWNMVSDILEEVPSNKNFIEVETPGGKMHIKNDPEIIADLLTELGARDMSRPLKGKKLEVIEPNIDKSQLAKDMYYANIKGEFLPVIGAKPFGIPGTEELDLFRYKPSKQPGDKFSSNSDWIIAEGKSGKIVAHGRTIQDAA